MRFRLTLHDTLEDDKYLARASYEFFGDRDGIWFLWFTLTKKLNKKHVEVFSLDGRKLSPELGISYMSDYNI